MATKSPPVGFDNQRTSTDKKSDHTITTMAATRGQNASKLTELRDSHSDEFDKSDDNGSGYDDDFTLGASSVGGGRYSTSGCKGSKKTNGAGNSGPYSAKHTRLRESRKSGK